MSDNDLGHQLNRSIDLAAKVGEVLTQRTNLAQDRFQARISRAFDREIAPLLTRLALHPFVALDHFPTAPFSIWVWSTLGSAFYHLSIYQVARKYLPNLQTRWVVLSAIASWVCSPGLLLSLNSVLYHEPISVAYGASGVAP